MSKKTINAVWEYLEQVIAEITSGEKAVWQEVEGLQAALVLLLENDPAAIVARIEASSLPTRAVVSWLVFEGQKIKGLDPACIQALQVYWQSTCAPGQGIIRPPNVKD